MRTAVIYCRISSDSEGRGEGVERQEADCRALAAERGYSVAEVIVENDVSATARSKKPRPQYRDMIRRARGGEWDAIIAYTSSRLNRRLSEAEELFELLDERRPPLRMHTVKSGDHENTAAGKGMAGMRAVWDVMEADQISERVEAAARQRAQKGRPNGRRAYGWDRVNGDDVINEDEAGVLRALAGAVLDGGKLLPLARDLNARGVESPSQGARRRAEAFDRKPPKAKPWDGTTIRKLLLRESNCGRRVFNGEVVAINEDMALWPEGQQERLRAILTDPRRTTTRGTGPKRLMTGLLICGKCGGRCRARVGRPDYYECSECFGVRATVADVDELVGEVILARLTSEDGPSLLAEDPEAARAARDELETVRARLDNAADDYADGVIDRDQMRRITERLRPRIEEGERRVAAAMPSPAVARLADRIEGIEAAWPALDLSTRRDFVRALATFKLRPARAKGVRWTLDRLGVEWVA